jgi:hypothetical protein
MCVQITGSALHFFLFVYLRGRAVYGRASHENSRSWLSDEPCMNIAARPVPCAGPEVPSPLDTVIAIGVAATVTGCRAVLLRTWPDFRQATDASNQQALGPLQPADLLIVALLPAVSEELLFRGALLPAIYPDARGVVISAAVFGALHVPGGRNAAFAVWATAVGAAYGCAFLATGNLAVPMVAHGLSNLASGWFWKAGWTREEGSG